MQKITQQRYSVIIILLLIAWLSVIHLNESIWTDEQRTLHYAGAAPQYGSITVVESLERIAKNLWQAPAYYLMQWGWGRVAGWSVFAMRLPSVFYGLLAVAGTYHLARRYYSKDVGFYAALTMGFNAFFINFMHDMRTYILFVTLTVFMFWWYAFITRAKRPLIGYIGFTLLVTWMLYTHYFSVFPIAALGLCHLIFQRRKRYFVPMIICFVIAGVLFLPWVQVLMGGADRATGDIRSINNLSLVEGVSNILYLFSNGGQAFLLLLLLFAAAERHLKNNFIAVWIIAGYALLWGVTRIVPAFTEVKYVIFFWPALAVAAGVGIQYLQRLGINPLLLLFVWIAMFIGNLSSPVQRDRIHPFYTPPLKELAEAITPYTQADDAILFVLPELEEFVEDEMIEYYFYGDDNLRTAVIRDAFSTTDEFFQAQVITAIQNAGRVWLTYEAPYRNWHIGPIEEQMLPDAGFAFCGVVVEDAAIFASLYAHHMDSNNHYEFTTTDNNPIELQLLFPPDISRTGQLSLAVGWYIAPEIFGNPYSIALHIEDEQGNLLGQADFGIEQPAFDCQVQQVDISAMPAGELHIKATVYNWQTGVRLQSVAPAPDNERPVIATIAHS